MTSISGVGLGLRKPHIEAVHSLGSAPVPFWEIAPENVMGMGGRIHGLTMEILTGTPTLTHGITMSIGGFDAYEDDYIQQLNGFLRAVGTPFHSEHLCWSTHGGLNTHDLLPLPFTGEAVRHTVRRIRELQARLDVPFLIENISYYAELGAPEMSEKAFMVEVLEGADCGWLLDINNLYVNSQNFGFDPKAANSPAALSGLLIVFALGPAIAHAFSAALIARFPLDEAAHAEIRRQLDPGPPDYAFAE